MLDHDLKYWRISRVVKIDFDVSTNFMHKVADPCLSVCLVQKYIINHSA